ncbi:hypothetical protein LCGC14_0761920 [marine sediment metagenome]|uniref:Uncharacterized protein n=1 Tax=marine sediment metagenome TaxID=412755 RepID=A0A0F9SKV1_9ZZZZ
MKFQEVKNEILRIAQISDPLKVVEEVKKLHYELFERPKIKRPVKRGNFYYFYLIKSYDKKGHEILGKKLGRISIQDYEENEEIIEQYRKAGNIEKLQKYTQL